MSNATAPMPVRTLVCHRDVELTLHCWRTLLACCADPIELVAHDDGSLTDEDVAALCAAIPRLRVLRRAEADAIMAERLARHPHARAFRTDWVWGLKLLDVALAEDGDCCYLDGDIRFFRPFRGLFRHDALAGRCIFLRDTVWAAYSVRPWHLGGRRGLQVVKGTNTGLTLIDRTRFDLDFVDWFLSQPDWRAIPGWVEPTCWAALATRANGYAVDPRQIVNLYPEARITGETIGAHFLSSFRHRFAAELAQPCATGPAEEIRFDKLEVLTPIGLGVNQLQRKIRNEFVRRRARN